MSEAQLPLAFTTSMATGASQTQALDLGGAYTFLSLEIPSQVAGQYTVAGTPLYVLGSSDGSTFRRMTQEQPNTSTTTIIDFVIASNTTNRIIPIVGFNSRYFKLEASANVSAATATFKVICSL